MGLFNKLKGHIDKVKENVSKQDVLDLVTDAQKTLVEGGGSDAAKNKAALKFAVGLGKMAMGKYEGDSRQLENMEKDPYDVQQAQETTDCLNAALAEKLNPRMFIYGNPDVIEDMGVKIVELMNFIGLVQDKTLIPRIHELLKNNNVNYDANKMEKEVNKFIRNQDVTQLMSIRHQVDKLIFIDRKTKEEILAMNDNLNYSKQKHYKYECEYCGRKFETVPETNSLKYYCSRSPMGPNNGPHKIHSIGAEKLWT